MGRLALVLMVGCAGPDWRNADLQIDVSGLEIHDQDRVRICVQGAGQRELAVGAGRMSFPGLPGTGELSIRVDLMDEDLRLARAGPTTLGLVADHAVLQWQGCTTDCVLCEDPGRGAEDGVKSRLLAVRFIDVPRGTSTERSP